MLQTLRRIRARLRADDRGASLVEYAMLMALIAFVCIGALTYFGNESGNSAETSAELHRGGLRRLGPAGGVQR